MEGPDFESTPGAQRPGCLLSAEIERLAAGEDAPPEVDAHVSSCSLCRERLEAAQEEVTFLRRVRMLAPQGTGRDGSTATGGMPRIEGYLLLGVIAAGSQGVVYRAVQETTSRTVAIKTLFPGGTTRRQRLRAEREAEIAASLRHPNIVTIFESRSLTDGRTAVIMEYVDGVPFDEWEPNEEGVRRVLRAFVDVCRAIHHAHLNGVIHRDLKPDNILVTQEGRPVVLDFGIARAGDVRATRTGEFAGTPAYASPEQVSGAPELVDALTDIYSLGVVLYRVLCRSLPYDLEGSMFDMARSIRESRPVRPRDRNPALSADLEAVILRALEKEKHRRYQSAAAFGRDIERVLTGGVVEARSASGWYLLRKAVHVNRRRLAWAGAATTIIAAALGAVAFSATSVALSTRIARERQEDARIEGARARAMTELLREALPDAGPARPELGAATSAGLARLYLRLETGEFADDPDVDQSIRRLWASLYSGLGSGKNPGLIEYSEASLRSGLARLRLHYGDEHPEVAAALHELAGVLLVRKRFAEAEVNARAALAAWRKSAGAGGPERLPAVLSRVLLARVLHEQGRSEESRSEAETALEQLQQHSGREAELAGASLRSLLSREALKSDLLRAESLAREALAVRLRWLGPADPDLTSAMLLCADVTAAAPESGLGRELAAVWSPGPEGLVERVRSDVAALAAPDLGSWQQPVRTGRCEALGRLQRLQEIVLGRDDGAIVKTLIARIRAAECERLPQDKVVAALRASEILGLRFGKSDRFVQVCVHDAAITLALIGRAPEGVELARRAMEIERSAPAGIADPLSVANARRYFAMVLSLSGRQDEAIAEYEGAEAECVASVGPEHHMVALTRAGLAIALHERGRGDDAQRADSIAREAYELALRRTTAGDQMAQIRFALAHVTVASDPRAALDLIDKAWDPSFRLASPEFAWRRMLIGDARDACERLGDTRAAEAWGSRLDRWEVAVLDPAEK